MDRLISGEMANKADRNHAGLTIKIIKVLCGR